MNRMGAVWLAIIAGAIFVVIANDAQSKRRSQQVGVEQPTTAITKQKSNEDQRGTEQSPLIVKVAPTPKTDDERAEETKERERVADSERKKEKSDTDLVGYTAELASFTKYLVVATVALVIATVGLGVAAFLQSRDMKESIKIARLQAKALVGVELPIVVAMDFVINAVQGTPREFGNLPEYPFVSLRFFNFGRSPAELIEYNIVPSIISSLPDPPAPRNNYPLAPGTILTANGGWQQFNQMFEWSETERAEILQGNTRLWVYGSVAFFDFLGNRHDVGFCAMAIPAEHNTLRFVYSGDTPAAYTRKSQQHYC